MKFKHLNQAGEWPSGNPRLYYRPKGEHAVGLPDISKSDPSFEAEYDAARREHFRLSEIYAENRDHASVCVRRARIRAKERGRECTLTIDDVLQMLHDQKQRCALTGLPFDLSWGSATTRRPFAPSIDQIIPGGGYHKENARLVTLVANLARADFGDDAFFRMCRAASKHEKFQRSEPVTTLEGQAIET